MSTNDSGRRKRALARLRALPSLPGGMLMASSFPTCARLEKAELAVAFLVSLCDQLPSPGDLGDGAEEHIRAHLTALGFDVSEMIDTVDAIWRKWEGSREDAT
jgi:hypothetical protein